MISDAPMQLIVHLDAPELGARRPVGIARVTGRDRETVAFTYARSWLDSRHAFEIDPRLPLVEHDQFSAPGNLPGILADTAPDRWGRTLIDRREVAVAGREGRRPRRLTEWDYLLAVSDVGRMGALRYTATPSDHVFLAEGGDSIPPFTRLRALEQAARRFEESATSGLDGDLQELALLLAPGSSLGGARPKASYEAEEGGSWIAKFPSAMDGREIGAWEFVLVELAARAGITVPEHKLLTLGPNGRTYVARRFDRSGDSRRLFASAMTLTSHHDGDEASYLEIAHVITTHGAQQAISEDLEQLFRRVVFNVITANRDDHLRNHAFVRLPDGWRLAPAFDLNPAPDKAEHSLALDDSSRAPDLGVVQSTADWYRLDAQRARGIISEVQGAVRGWETLARDVRLPSHEIALMANGISTGS